MSITIYETCDHGNAWDAHGGVKFKASAKYGDPDWAAECPCKFVVVAEGKRQRSMPVKKAWGEPDAVGD